jgi:hypothetical protein
LREYGEDETTAAEFEAKIFEEIRRHRSSFGIMC